MIRNSHIWCLSNIVPNISLQLTPFLVNSRIIFVINKMSVFLVLQFIFDAKKYLWCTMLHFDTVNVSNVQMKAADSST